MNASSNSRWDLLIAGGRVVDPARTTDAHLDIALKNGRVAEIGAGLDTSRADVVQSAQGRVVVPGLIDPHVHMDDLPHGYFMTAETGVVTAIDFAGSAQAIRRAVNDHGVAGLSVGFLKPVVPGRTVSGPAVPEDEQEQFLDSLVEDGALGVKLLGGHYPLEPDTIANFIKRCAERNHFIASHVGSTRNGSNIDGLREAIELANGNPLYIAHVNSYCRGASGQHPVREAALALEWITAARNLTTENYIARINGCSGECRDGIPISRVTRVSLERGGYSGDENGMAQAIQEGFARVQIPESQVVILADAEPGLEAWRKNKTRMRVSFPVNSIAACCALATARDDSNKLIIDILCTDGGRIPRNTLVSAGLAMVRADGWSLADFVEKTAVQPARAFGLTGKGHLGPGADGDVTVLDTDRGVATLSIASGRIIMQDGHALGGEGRWLTRESLSEGVR